ncbi:DNA-binding protein [Sphingobium chlorophenolicum]|uniref:DNA-binding protein n=1 Tax=Sphingobium chlorophenolicum TaxID=46429 RepID=UPI0012DCB5C1|nr:DNA-binding protein [Sphingobium chlorophenolicum]
MVQGLSRAHLKALSLSKLDDAALLFQCERWASAYYLAGYAVELGLKACAATQFSAETIPDKKLVNSLHTHSLDSLVGLAGLRADLRAKQDEDSEFSANWGITLEWVPESRYESTDKSSAHYLINAIQNEQHGVLPWIQTHW